MMKHAVGNCTAIGETVGAHAHWTIAILAIALLFAFGCAGKPSAPVVEEPVVVVPPQENATAAAVPCSSGNVVQKDGCFASLADELSDPEICRNIYSVEKVDSCYAAFANSSLEICKRITGADLRAICLTANAVAAKSEDACNLIDNAGRRAACLEEVLPPCMAVLDPEKRSECLAIEKGDYTICTTDACFENYAIEKSDENACGLISGTAERYACRAEVRKEISFCRTAELAPVQDLCVKLASVRLNDESGCSFAASGSDYRNACHLYFAVKLHDSSICSKTAPEESRDVCYSDWATLSANTSSCPKIIESLNRISCYYNAAAKNRVASLCNPLPVETQRNDCYSKAVFAEGGPVPSDCGLVVSQEWRDKCYYRAARATYNSTYCEPITPGPDKESCNSLFG